MQILWEFHAYETLYRANSSGCIQHAKLIQPVSYIVEALATLRDKVS